MRRRVGIKLALTTTAFVVLTACTGLNSDPMGTDPDGRDGDTTDSDTTDPGPDPDTTDPDPGTTEPDPDTTDPDPDTTPAGCVPVVVNPELVNDAELGWVAAIASPQLGTASPDFLVMQFFSDATGSFDLGSGGNSNYASCDQCVLAVVDAEGEAANLFQTSGSITVASPPSGDTLQVVLSGVELTEVTIANDGTFTSTPVPGGECIALQSPLTLGSAQCVPECSGQVCGDDGCGGSCGSCDGGEVCAPAGDECLDLTCDAVTVEDDLEPVAANVYQASIGSTTSLGADLLQVEFYTSDTGSFDLGSGGNSNYAGCEQCVRAFEPTDTRQWYQSGGTLQVNDDPQDASLNAVLTDGTLIEVTIATDGSFTSTPVADGECIELPTPLTLVASPPDAPTCEPLSPPTTLDVLGLNAYGAELPGTDTLGIDFFQVEFYAGTTGIVDLSSGANADYASCTQCVRAFAGDTRQFYQSGGTMNVLDSPDDGTLNATITDGTLVEVSIDSVTLSTTPVAGGECLELPSTITFTAQ